MALGHRTLVLYPHFKQQPFARQPEACLEETIGLAHAIDLEVADSAIVPLAKATPSTLFGSGKVEELKGRIAAGDITLAVVGGKLSPVQQRNLEKAWGCKVIDRTALILEIFGARARTHEGKLQVEIAALEYQKSRLVRSWTHLERQRGGFGFLGGPGESQIELDRRLIRDRLARLKKELAQVSRTRELHRKTRRDVPYPVIALVGYTNAGKSTLFNRLTGANVLSMDKLFATLDPTMRAIYLPDGGKAILSDTVGFVSDLPTELVASFRATLEEVLEADLLLHVRDISHPDAEAQKRDVEQVLTGLFGHRPEHVIEVWNKVDKLISSPLEGEQTRTSASLREVRVVGGCLNNDELPPTLRASSPAETRAQPLPLKGGAKVSALTGQGIDLLLAAISTEMNKHAMRASYTLPVEDGKSLAWLHAHGKVVEQRIEDEYIHVTVQLSEENIRRFGSLQHAPTK